MPPSASDQRINIRPEVSILSVLRHLNYKPWFALAEFVDNALQSFLANRQAIGTADGTAGRLRVSIEIDPTDGGRLVVRDNAAGISAKDYARAFKPAEVPPDRTGLSEFGMGMKSAACWLAREWTVRTSALGEPVEGTVSFDVSAIIEQRLEELVVASQPARPEAHYTEIVLCGIHKLPQGRTVGKIKSHLASIYRVFIRDGTMELTYGGEPLAWEQPQILTATYYRSPEAEPVQWRKDIDFDFGSGQRAWGFAALREKGAVADAGFSLFRRNRVIEGSGDEGYRPEAIFGKSNSFSYQRLFGELHLDGFEVSHTKDGFRWEEHEDTFLELLQEHLDADPLPLLAQAEGYRSRPARSSFTAGAREAVERTAGVIERDVPQVLVEQIDAGPDPEPPPATLAAAASTAGEREIEVELHGQRWRIVIELTTDPAVGDWVSFSDRPHQGPTSEDYRRVAIRMSLAHPFTDRFGGTDAARIEPLLRLAAAIGLAEVVARESGVQIAGTFRRSINDLLRRALSNP